MTQPTPPGGGLNLRGAVDLGALAARSQRREQAQQRAAQGGAPAGGGFVVEATEETFTEVVQQSVTVPVVVNLHSPRFPGSAELAGVLRELVAELDGRLLLAEVDIDAQPRLAQAFQTQTPLVVGVVRGQPIPLFEGAHPREQVEPVLAELLRVAEANGVTGRVEAAPAAAAAPEAEESLPPLHQEAYDAIDAGDLQAAASAYERALAADPRDGDAEAGLAQVHIMQRLQHVDSAQARRAAADDPADVAAQLVVADIDVLGGHVEDAFARLLQVVRTSAGEDREAARAHLVELFTVVGAEDSRVVSARAALSRALF
ncbi:tetratricopeptide repeat protein [Kineococcus glutinatus]|uniref:Tetratricopeptide repeat protein n=1 Tax=Kineococcus glutinatus TaxID=1070872 RepID=A0ABP9HUZ2_9ACTN